METKTFLGVIATILAVVGYIPYIRDTMAGKTKPHAFSWFIWAILGYIAGIGQLVGGGGFGSAVTLTTATISLGIAIYAFQKGSATITKSDTFSLLAALAAIPLWVITRGPLLSVILVSVIDVLGFWPTMRKSFHRPHDETLITWVLATIKHFLTVVAQQRYNLITILYPASLGLLTLGFVTMLIIRGSTTLARQR